MSSTTPTTSPTPWRFDKDDDEIIDANGTCVIDTLSMVDDELAIVPFIVAAVNSHAALVDLLKRINGWDHFDSSGDGPYWRKEIAAALALVEGVHV